MSYIFNFTSSSFGKGLGSETAGVHMQVFHTGVSLLLPVFLRPLPPTHTPSPFFLSFFLEEVVEVKMIIIIPYYYDQFNNSKQHTDTRAHRHKRKYTRTYTHTRARARARMHTRVKRAFLWENGSTVVLMTVSWQL